MLRFVAYYKYGTSKNKIREENIMWFETWIVHTHEIWHSGIQELRELSCKHMWFLVGITTQPLKL